MLFIGLSLVLVSCAPSPSHVSGEVVQVREHRWGMANTTPRAGWGQRDTAPEDTGIAAPATPFPTVPDGTVSPVQQRPPIIVFAVRHAEKDAGSDPGLTEEGLARADALAVRLTDQPLNAVYATTYRRTQETAQPTADDHDLEVITDYDPEDELAGHILGRHRGHAVLHAGHSFTLPDFMNAIGVEPGDFYLSGYGQLWILEIDDLGRVEVTEERYGD